MWRKRSPKQNNHFKHNVGQDARQESVSNKTCAYISRCVSGRTLTNWGLFWTWSWENMGNLKKSCCREYTTLPNTVWKPVSHLHLCLFVINELSKRKRILQLCVLSFQITLASSISCLLEWTTMPWLDASSRRHSTLVSKCGLVGISVRPWRKDKSVTTVTTW